MKTDKQLYRFHVENAREVETALLHVFRHLRSAVARDESTTQRAFSRLGVFLVACSAEARLNKLLYEPGALSSSDRLTLENEKRLLQRWEATVEFGFRRHYNVPRVSLDRTSLPHSAASRLFELRDLLHRDLAPVIELRNRLAHGQWAYPLNRTGTDVVPEKYRALQKENILSLQYKNRLLHHLGEAIHDLLVSKPTFERDFDSHYKAIEDTRRDLKNRAFSDYAEHMRRKARRGRALRAASQK